MSEKEMSLELFEEACAAYGRCIGTSGCLEETASYMKETFGLSEEYAEELAEAAFAEWVEAYCD